MIKRLKINSAELTFESGDEYFQNPFPADQRGNSWIPVEFIAQQYNAYTYAMNNQTKKTVRSTEISHNHIPNFLVNSRWIIEPFFLINY